MSDRRRLLGDLSWFQIFVGALAAMTSAWIASALGVGGTIIGAAIGSMVVPISGALYGRTLDKGRVLVVRTDRGTVVQQRVDESEVTAPMGETELIDEVVDENPRIRDAALVEEPRRVRWGSIVVTAVAVLAIAFVAMGAYEVISGQAYGSDPDNSRIGNPFGGPPADNDPTPTPTATAPTPVEPTATATPTPEPSITPAPSPTVDPTVPTE